MLHWLCPHCGVRCETSLPERVNTPCGLCVATATWEQLPAAAHRMIDDAIRRGNIPGLLAMRAADPPINLPHAMDALEYRHQAGVRPGDASS
ncbi:hypothetical protein [Dactylosporangium sp. NPDC049140]|uniref:hypothetical protein n=1 Tax=Dactylosporangium sp. NPDC049140 TaxID=3155647 RepID=UPI0033FCEDC4